MPQNRDKRATMPDTQQLPEIIKRLKQQFFEDDMSAVRHIDTNTNSLSEMEMLEQFIKQEFFQAIQSAEATYKAELIRKIKGSKLTKESGISIARRDPYNDALDDVLSIIKE